MFDKKGQVAGIVGTVVLAVVGVILLVGVLSPITSNLSGNGYYRYDNANMTGFTGTNKTIADNLVTFVLLGTLIFIAGSFVMSRA